MDSGKNVIHIIGGDEADKRPIAATGYGYGVRSGGNAVANMFFKTDMCREVLSGRTCPHGSNCRFAHSIEELRNLERNYQEFGSPDGDFDRTSKYRHCKKFYSELGCPLGDRCNFIHDNQIKGRESTTIILGGAYAGDPAAPSPLAALPPLTPRAPLFRPTPPLAPMPTPPLAPMPTQQQISPLTGKPMNWRTRICKKWEYSGFCPFGSSCGFAHGEGELQHFGGGLVNPEANVNKQEYVIAGAGSPATRVVAAPGSSVAGVGGSEQPSGSVKRRWKDLNKINGIYGDWIDDPE